MGIGRSAGPSAVITDIAPAVSSAPASARPTWPSSRWARPSPSASEYGTASPGSSRTGAGVSTRDGMVSPSRGAAGIVVEHLAGGNQIRAEEPVGVVPPADALQTAEILRAQETVGPAREVGVSEVHAFADRARQPLRVAQHPLLMALVLGRVR